MTVFGPKVSAEVSHRSVVSATCPAFRVSINLISGSAAAFPLRSRALKPSPRLSFTRSNGVCDFFIPVNSGMTVSLPCSGRRVREVAWEPRGRVGFASGCRAPHFQRTVLTPPSLPPPGLGRFACETACPLQRVPVAGSTCVLTHVCNWTCCGEVGLPGRCDRMGRGWTLGQWPMTAMTLPSAFPRGGRVAGPAAAGVGSGAQSGQGLCLPWAPGAGHSAVPVQSKGPGGGPSMTEDERETLVTMKTGSRRASHPSSPF